MFPKKEAKAATSAATSGVPAATPAPEVVVQKLPYPKCVWLILTHQLLERFCYYGTKTILSLYMMTILNITQRNTTILFHLFSALVYFTPIMGGYIADNWLGSYYTSFYTSLVYIAGQILLCVSSLPLGIPKIPISAFSLVLITIGVGGIKPCVTVFGGDQFTLPQQEKELESYFSCFYFCINIGSAISTLVIPVLRGLRCAGEDTCYPIAYGIPSIALIAALTVFVVGKPHYKIHHSKGTMTELCKCICHGLYKKRHHTEGDVVKHWLDRAEDKFDKAMITDAKRVLRILVILLPGIVFWALYDQSGSTWTNQACRMDSIVGPLTIWPELMQLVNPILILIMIPFFNYAIYPLLLKMGLLKRQLSRMCCGGFLLTISFAMVSVVSLMLELNDPATPKAGNAHLRIYNSLKCTPTITSGVFDAPTAIGSMDFTMTKVHNVIGESTHEWTVANCDAFSEKQGKFILEEKESKGYYLSKKGMISFKDDITKDQKMSGYPKLRVLMDNPDIKLDLKVTTPDGVGCHLRDADDPDKIKELSTSEPVQFTVSPGEIKLMDFDKVVHVKQGGVYVIFIETQDQTIKDLTLVEVTKPNQISILWQLPQYIVYTAGEIMFSITAIEFSYTQAPVHMKSFVQSLQFFMTFLGNVVTIILKAASMFDRNISAKWTSDSIISLFLNDHRPLTTAL